MITLTIAFALTLLSLCCLIFIGSREIHEQVRWFMRVGRSPRTTQILMWSVESVAKRWSRTDIRNQLGARSLRH